MLGRIDGAEEAPLLCGPAEVPRARVYRRFAAGMPEDAHAEDLRLCRLIDARSLIRPFYGNRHMMALLRSLLIFSR